MVGKVVRPVCGRVRVGDRARAFHEDDLLSVASNPFAAIAGYPVAPKLAQVVSTASPRVALR